MDTEENARAPKPFGMTTGSDVVDLVSLLCSGPGKKPGGKSGIEERIVDSSELESVHSDDVIIPPDADYVAEQGSDFNGDDRDDGEASMEETKTQIIPPPPKAPPPKLRLSKNMVAVREEPPVPSWLVVVPGQTWQQTIIGGLAVVAVLLFLLLL